MNAPARKPVCHILEFADGGRLLVVAVRKARPSALLLRLLDRARSWIAASIGLLAGVIFSGAQAQVTPTALPTDGRVVSGQASVNQNGARMDVRQDSAKAILNWGSFNIGAQAQVNFAQPSTTAVALNRVLASDASQIHGRLSANGQVFLLNPNGVLFGPNARVDVGGFVASTLAIKDSDFLTGNYRFTRDGATGRIVNQGTLSAKDGGYVALLAPEVRNQGVIQATLGTVALAAGEAATLKFNADALVSVAVDPAKVTTLIENKNLIRADGGTVILSAKAADELAGAAIQAGGIIAADTLQSRNGQIVLDAGSNGAVEISGALSAQGKSDGAPAGGSIEVSGDKVRVLKATVDTSGISQGGTVRLGVGSPDLGASTSAREVLVDAASQVNANGGSGGQVELRAGAGETHLLGSVQARGTASRGLGGSIRLLGERVAVYGKANVDASGSGAGGEVLVGGDYQGKNPNVQNARATYVGRDATLAANALAEGDGGRVIVWSNDATRVHGSLEAKGGKAWGSGGFVETSGKFLDTAGARVNASASAGVAGQWFLDPFDIEIVPYGGSNLEFSWSGTTDPPDFTSNKENARVGDAIISAVLNSGTNVSISTGAGGEGRGDVTFRRRICSGEFCEVPARINKTLGGDAALQINAHGSIVMGEGSSIASSSGRLNVSFKSNSKGGDDGGITMHKDSSIVIPGGTIVFWGGSSTGLAAGNPAGIDIQGATLSAAIEGGHGRIFLSGSGSTSGGVGVRIQRSSVSADSIEIDGIAPTTSQGHAGVLITSSSSIRGMSIHISGRTNSEDDSPIGKFWSTLIEGASTINASSNGSVSISGSDGYVGIRDGARVEASGTTPITIWARNPDIWSSYIGGVEYAGDITFLGRWITLERRSAQAGPEIVTSGNVAFQPLEALFGSDLIVGLEAAQFSPRIRKILIGNANTRDLYFHNSNGLTPSAGPITVDPPVTFQANGTVYVGAAPSSYPYWSNSGVIGKAAGDAITVVTGAFSNQSTSGSSALSAPNGRWLVYAADPSTSTEGFPSSSYSKHYNQRFVSSGPPDYAKTGNWFFYSVAPTLSVTPGSRTITYGDATAFTPTYAGFIDEDTPSTAVNGSAGWRVGGPTSSSGNPTAGEGHDVSYIGGLASSLGYQFADNAASRDELAVTRRNVAPNYVGQNKVYDGTTAAKVIGSSPDIIASDAVSFSQTATFVDKNVGRAKTVNVTDIVLVGADAANYALLNATAATSADILARGLSVAARYTASNKVYDGTTAASVVGSSADIIAGDAVSFSQSAAFVDKNAGVAKRVNVTDITLVGEDVANYALLNTSATATADISAKPLTARYSASNKVYDGTTAATVIGSSADIITGDVVGFRQNAAFVDKNVGVAKTVNITDIAMVGADAANYALLNATATTTADIIARGLSVAARYTASNKVYDGTTAVTVFGSSADIIAGDAVSFSQRAAFVDKNVGVGKTVNVSDIALVGEDAANYALLNTTATTTADISAKPLTARYIASNKVYDGTTAASVFGSSADIIAGDAVSFSQKAAFVDKNAALAKTVNVTDITLTGADAANYALLNTTGTTAADIIAKALAVTANDARITFNGRPYAGGNGVTYAGFVNGETSAVLGGTLVYGGNAQGAVIPGSYLITPSGLSSANYQISYFDGTLSIAPIVPVDDSGSVQRPIRPPEVPTPEVVPVTNNPPLLESWTLSVAPDLIAVGEAPVSGAEVVETTESEAAAGETAEGKAGEAADTELGRRLAALAVAEEARHRARTDLYKQAVAAIRANPAVADVPECDGEPKKDQQRKEACIPRPKKAVAQAETAPTADEPRRKTAILFGNNAYKGKIPRLQTPIHDVMTVSEVLQSHMGYDVRVVRNATKRDTIAVLKELAESTTPEDSVLIMYAGHGYLMDDTKQGFWIPVDANHTDARTWLSNNDIYRLLGVIPAKQVILISDSCFSGTLTKEQKLETARAAKKEILRKRSVVAMSSGDETPVADVGLDKHSVFAYHLIKRLRGGADDEAASELLDAIRAQVRKVYPQDPQIGGVVSAGHTRGGDYLFLHKD